VIGTSASVTGVDGVSLGGASHSVLQVYQMSAPTNRIRGLNLKRCDATPCPITIQFKLFTLTGIEA
jgi:hypothetical protein